MEAYPSQVIQEAAAEVSSPTVRMVGLETVVNLTYSAAASAARATTSRLAGGGQNGTGTYAGSGGGGFSGGNGGNRASAREGGGGGGSLNNGTNQVNAVLTATGHGKVIITELCSISLTSSGSNSLNPSICAGQSVTLTTNAVSNYSWSTGATSSSLVVAPATTTVYSLSALSPSNCTAARSITVTVSAGVPTLNIATASPSICLGNTLSLSVSGAFTYTWSGSNATTSSVSFTPVVTTTYVVTGQNGCGTSTAALVVTVAPLAVAMAASPATICAGSPATLTAVTPATQFTWSPAAGTTSLVVVNPSQTTTYSLAVSDGTCYGGSTVSLFVNPVPTVTLFPTVATICAGDVATISVTGGNSYTWTPAIGSGASATYAPLTSTVVTITGDNSFGCTASVQQIIIVNPLPTINPAASAVLICPGTSVTLTASGSANTYTWFNSVTNTSTTVSPTVNTTYSITGTFTNTQCSKVNTITIDVFDPPLAITGNSTVCLGETTTLTATGGADSYLWSTGLPFQFITETPTVSSVYMVTVMTTTSSVTCQKSATFQVIVNPTPTVTAVASRSVICKGELAVITGSGANTYSWSSGESSAVITVTGSAVGFQNFTVTGTNTFNCSSAANLMVKVDGCNGLSPEQKTTLSVYPNPNGGAFMIESESDAELTIVNQLGQTVRHVHVNAGLQQEVNIQELQAGIYFLVGRADGVNINQKLILSR
jgi:hypothetical protein